ncbi:hypothetical protein PENTCL1PPCAC_23143, partial [Pristionchus entomophagus]
IRCTSMASEGSSQALSSSQRGDSSSALRPLTSEGDGLRSASGMAYGSEMGYSESSVSQSRAAPSSVGHGRDDLRPERHRTIRVNMDDDLADDEEARVYIWGTRICVADVQKAFRDFITSWKASDLDEDEAIMHLPSERRQEVDTSAPLYLEKLYEIDQTEIPILNVNLSHVKNYNEALYRKIIAYPAEVIPYLDMTTNEIYIEKFQRKLSSPIELRPFNADKTRNMRSLNPGDIDQLITITGMVTRTSMLIPEMRQGFFRCTQCHHSIENEVDHGRIEEPSVCPNCSNTYSFNLIHNRSMYLDKQIIKLQESPDDMPSGQTPHTVTVFAHGALSESVQPGDRVTLTGIFRAQAVRSNPKQRALNSVYRSNIDALHFRKTDKQRLHQDNGENLTETRIAQIKRLAAREDVVDALAAAIAPSIFEHSDVKRGLLCLLFGGTPKDDKNEKTKLRSEINILLCGDPGTSKSQLLQYVFQLMPRSQYTSGKGSSAVGLTASVSRDPDTKQLVLQTGALVLADKGVCCIDEFDKMSDSARSVLHEVMEQQTLSIAKAGIICQLNARASLLAAANPVDSKWNTSKTIVENMDLPHTLLSRFDLIFLLVDPHDEENDRRLANHLVSLYYQTNAERAEQDLDMALLRDYIAYAKATVQPRLTDEATQLLIDKYMFMRKAGASVGQITAYPRQLESLIRLAEAYAKIHLRVEVTTSDVECAHALYRDALKQSATDPTTGRVDVNILAAGMSATTRKNVETLAKAIAAHLEATSKGENVSAKMLLQQLREKEHTVSRELFDDALTELLKKEQIVRTGDRIRYLVSAS